MVSTNNLYFLEVFERVFNRHYRKPDNRKFFPKQCYRKNTKKTFRKLNYLNAFTFYITINNYNSITTIYIILNYILIDKRLSDFDFPFPCTPGFFSPSILIQTIQMQRLTDHDKLFRFPNP